MTEMGDFDHASRNDCTVATMLKLGNSLEEIIAMLANEKQSLIDKVIGLEMICPKRIRNKKGEVFIYRCPDDLVPYITESEFP